MRFFDRREFLKQSAGLSGLIAAGYFATEAPAAQQEAPPATPRGANEQLNIAVIGVRGRGLDHIGGLAGKHNCRVTHLCDVDTAVTGPAVAKVQREQRGAAPTVVQDLRRIMDNRDIHAVSIATPNHWHSLAAIWALAAGKHVYVEKPVSHNVWEGRRLVEASRHYNKICQAGTQIRSNPGIREAMQFIQDGRLGRCAVARGLCYKRRDTIRRCDGPQQPPASMDYNLWCGPASNAPPRRNGNFGPVHYDWHWIWEYGNGDLGNQGIHQMDVARWGLAKSELPASCISVGGRFGYVDDGETPNTQIAVMDYGNAELIFEVRGLNPMGNFRNAQVGNVFHCADGYLVCTSYNTAIAFDNNNREIRRFTGNGDHYGNFVACVRSGRRQDQKGEVLEGHLSSALCHLANISYRLGRQVAFDRRAGVLGEGQSANETLGRMVDHLRDRNVDLARTMLTVGERLNIDPRRENFGDNQAANRLLTREYRQGFEVPARF